MMSSIPASAMKHAHAHDDQAAPAEDASRVAYLTEEARAKARALNDRAVDGVKKHPAAAITAGVAAALGMVAAVAIPILRARAAARAKIATKPRSRTAAKSRAAAKPKVARAKAVSAPAKRKPAARASKKATK
jgi:hypothetical protein